MVWTFLPSSVILHLLYLTMHLYPSLESASMSNVPNLPQEMIIEILSRLPVKSLCAFKSVSKPWKALMSNTDFIQMHLNHNTHNSKKLIIISPSSHSLFSIEFDDHKHGIATKLDFSHANLWAKVMGACNGLLFVVNIFGNHFLLNPSTRESVRFLGLPHTLDPSSVWVIYGFGYDQSSSDYKVVTITHHHVHNGDPIDDSVDVYSVKFREWKRVGKSFYDHPASVPWQGVYHNGSIHWLVIKNGGMKIAAFDLAGEVFDEIHAGPSWDQSSFWVYFYDLIVLAGCLSIVASSRNWVTDIWMMREYGVKESWVKYTIFNRDLYPMKPFALLGEKELVLQVYKENMLKYDLVERKLTGVVVNGIPDEYEFGVTFVESLVSPESFLV